MRRVLAYDIEKAAHELLGHPETEWSSLCAAWIQQADIAHRYFKRLGKTHPFWGRGALGDVVGGEGVTTANDRRRFSANEAVFHALVQHQCRLA